MEISINSVIFSPVVSPKTNFLMNSTHLKLTSLPCMRKNGGANDFFDTSTKLEVEGYGNSEMSQDMFQPSNFKLETKTNNDIWKLFKEAQQNIIYLNKQRLLAVEELHKVNQEKEFLLDRIEELQGENQAGFGKDKQSMCCELVLRIDSMVLTGMINAAEASNLRKAVMNYKFSIADMFFDSVHKNDVELLAELRHFSHGSKKSGFHIVHICTEFAPLVEVGSLASYVTGLSSALQKKGHFVEVILPKYSCLDLSEIQGLREIGAESYSYFNGQLHGNKIWTGVVNGLAVTFIQPLYYSSYFNREKVYGYTDDFERFSYFSRASLDYITKSGKLPDILHIHNWQTAIVGPLFWDIFVKQGLEGTRILMTCHDLDSQCLETPDKLALCGLDPDRLHRPDRLQDDANTQFVNILKGGVVYSNKVVMVSSLHSKGRIINNLNNGLKHTLSTHRVHIRAQYIICILHSFLLTMVLKALKYGAVPVAVASNEIKSRDFADHELETTEFSQFISTTFGNLSLTEALNQIKNNPSKWRQKIVNAMAMDFSWDAESYDVHVSAYDAIKNL